MSQVIIGYTTEGTSDRRFLESIIERTFVEIGFECNRQIEVLTPVIHIDKRLGTDFITQMKECASKAAESGVMVLCVHVDADNVNDSDAFQYKLNPLIQAAIDFDEEVYCKIITPIVPVQMTESWMLADKELLKEEIGTDLNDDQLEINSAPENLSNPKEKILNAIRIARAHLSQRRRRDLSIGELYLPIGQQLSLERLATLASYQKFKEAVRNSYRQLNYL